ncbi:MAG: methylmalonyl Co-A mutase-associated GTPase MeaB [Tissierellia bacterium]|nr:methylmalonyl Co-A mutase-associated GTPase MeaB [Tissierellia bacterium]
MNYKEVTWKNKRQIGRMISIVENAAPGHEKIFEQLYDKTGHAYVIGITGPPGAGKSSLTDTLAKAYISQEKKVGIIAVDPTSPFTGGSILGDRIRMNELSTDPRVFIRSMGTRGQLGGLSAGTASAVQVLDAVGADVIIIETVGVGQSEVEIIKHADSILMVMVPGLGDDIQAMKAGIMEIGDVFVINKSDLPGANKTKIEVEAMLSFMSKKGWVPPVLLASATRQEGIGEVVEALENHRLYQEKEGLLFERRKRNVNELLMEVLQDRLFRKIKKLEEYPQVLEDLTAKKIDPYTAAKRLFEQI